jgi:hypothetical protein
MKNKSVATGRSIEIRNLGKKQRLAQMAIISYITNK